MKKITWEKTKIVATLGPASMPKKVLRELFIAGVDVCRLNFSHAAYEEHEKAIKTIRELNAELGTHIPILADLQGPKIRIGEVENNHVELIDGKELIITTKKCMGTASRLYLTVPSFPKDVKPTETILIDDGKLALKVISTNLKDEVKCKVIHGGDLSSKKGVNLPNTKLSLPCLTEKDLNDLQFALDHNIEWIGLSFVRAATDIIELRSIIAKHKNKFKARIIAKIEKPEAVAAMDAIISVTDGIMVARGDLGVEIPMQNVPLVQKQLVKKCMQAGKPIIIATQMMESMITNFRPTRAEVNDVANNVMDGADAVMLSGETSVGKYPLEVIQAVQRIIREVEKYDGIYNKQYKPSSKEDNCLSNTICFNACEMAQQNQAKCIAGLTNTGYTAYRISGYRPKAGIFVFTHKKELLSTMNLSWGVRGFYMKEAKSTDAAIDQMKKILIKEGYISKKDTVIFTASTPINSVGKTNMLKIEEI